MKTCIKCGSHAFNLYAEGIDQGGLCDVHYWQGRAHRAEAQPAKGLFIDLIAQHEGLAEELAQPEQEPVEWPCVIETADFEEDTVTLKMQTSDYKVSAGKHWLSTTPPKRPWVGLTQKEVQEIHDTYYRRMGPQEFARAIEAKLKEKNNGN